MNNYIIFFLIFFLLFIFFFYYQKVKKVADQKQINEKNNNDLNKSIITLEQENINKDPNRLLNLNPFISCECKELETWHPGRVEHKLQCQKFWSLNPNRTKEELLKYEGFG